MVSTQQPLRQLRQTLRQRPHKTMTLSASGDEGDFMEAIVLPAAHHQILSSDPVYFEDLKGCDHHQDVFDINGYDSDNSSCAPKRRGGGSWLLSLVDPILPGLVRVESDECSTSSESDGESSLPYAPKKRARGGVAFNSVVKVQPVPHSNVLTAEQRRRMYSTSWEVRQNKIRNRKEYRYDGCAWRNATEERDMGVDMVTGELIHPAHEFSK